MKKNLKRQKIKRFKIEYLCVLQDSNFVLRKLLRLVISWKNSPSNKMYKITPLVKTILTITYITTIHCTPIMWLSYDHRSLRVHVNYVRVVQITIISVVVVTVQSALSTKINGMFSIHLPGILSVMCVITHSFVHYIDYRCDLAAREHGGKQCVHGLFYARKHQLQHRLCPQ